MWGRPPGVVLLVIGLIYFTALSLTRGIAAIQAWYILHILYPIGAPEYLLASGCIISGVSGSLVVGLWLGKPWAWKGICLFIPLYIVVGWLERGAMAFNFGWPVDWLYTLVANLIITLIAFVILFHKSTRRFIFGDDIHK